MNGNMISQSDIKYDLLKIIEPYYGIVTHKQYDKVLNLFNSYLGDLKKEKAIKDYTLSHNVNDTSITYHVGVKLSSDRSPKKLKIHVATFQYPWIKKEETV